MAFLITIYSGIPAKKEMSRLILALSMRTFQCPLESQKPAAFAAAPIPLLTRQATAKATKAKAGSNTSQASPDTSAVMVRNGMLSVNVCSSVTRACGVLRVPIACSSAGAVGNADDGTALILVTPVNGLPSSGVADTLTGGFDTEELETWRARVIERYYWTPQGGADGDYVVWAKEVPGITRAWTYRHWMGTGTVGVMIASSDLINPIPEESTETAARQHIEPLAPVAGSDLYVFRPVAHKVDFHIRVTPDTPEIRAAITAELRSFLLRDGYPQGELKVSRISEAISGANGEYSHQLLAPAENISIAKNELAVLGTISWT